MRAAKQATEALRDRLATPLLCQGDDATMLLVKRFAEDEETSLFGTLSLWQGVDVPGPSLSCVIIDRIPFPRPDDPLVSARQRAADSRGGNGFLQVSATHAALLLAQGAGRLLRGMDDRGVVAILDPRLATARYGGFLRASPAAVLADGRPGQGPRGAAPPPRRLTVPRSRTGSRVPAPAARARVGSRQPRPRSRSGDAPGRAPRCWCDGHLRGEPRGHASRRGEGATPASPATAPGSGCGSGRRRATP